MKYFTPEKFVALQTFDKPSMDGADSAWEDAVEQYNAYLKAIRPGLPESIGQLLDRYYLHDADVLSMGRRGDDFEVLLQLDIPPHELLTISYKMFEETRINRSALPAEHCSTGMQWMCDELEELKRNGHVHYLHSVLLSNGWEVQIPFEDMHVRAAKPIYPVRKSGGFDPAMSNVVHSG